MCLSTALLHILFIWLETVCFPHLCNNFCSDFTKLVFLLVVQLLAKADEMMKKQLQTCFSRQFDFYQLQRKKSDEFRVPHSSVAFLVSEAEDLHFCLVTSVKSL